MKINKYIGYAILACTTGVCVYYGTKAVKQLKEDAIENLKKKYAEDLKKEVPEASDEEIEKCINEELVEEIDETATKKIVSYVGATAASAAISCWAMDGLKYYYGQKCIGGILTNISLLCGCSRIDSCATDTLESVIGAEENAEKYYIEDHPIKSVMRNPHVILGATTLVGGRCLYTIVKNLNWL